MGVTGLWQIVQPCARPIKIETLNRKRLAVDASIWIYQFLKAVRDKEGNALRNSHVVGFFRRICKLLFFGIKPVFVFDGGAPVLKRQTITNRKRRREGRREDAVRTAGRLLAVQMQRRAEEEDQRRRDANSRANDRNEEQVDDQNLAYVDEIGMSQQERQQTRKFRKKDAYHLPDLDVSVAEMGGPNDQRVMSLEELEAYARQFDTGEDINVYDFNSIDYDSPFFTSLPASDRYNILNAARLRSRLRMGHSKDQLDTMFPDRMAFSKFQIERVQERNELTQRLMNINDPNGELEFGINGTGRIAGEKGREYVLVKNDGVEGGWALGVISNEGQRERPIDVDKPAITALPKEESDDDADFEDVPIEGLNRLPKRQKTHHHAPTYRSNQTHRRSTHRRGPRSSKKRKLLTIDQDSLFMPDINEVPEQHGTEDDSVSDTELFGEEQPADEDDDLQRALAMSMEKDDAVGREEQGEDDEELKRAIAMSMENADSEDGMHNVFEFQQTSVKDAAPIPHGSARAIASVLNKRAHQTAPESREVTSFGVPVPADDSESDDDTTMDLGAAMAQANPLKRKAEASSTSNQDRSKQSSAKSAAPSTTKQDKSSSLLPFARLDLGSSILGKKKMQQRTEEGEGGFINPELEPKKHAKENEPLPPWFNGDPEEDLRRQKELEDERDKRREQIKQQNYVFDNKAERRVLKRYETNEVIDLDADDDETTNDTAIDLTNDEEPQPHRTSPRETPAAETVERTPSDAYTQPDSLGNSQAQQNDTASNTKPTAAADHQEIRNASTVFDEESNSELEASNKEAGEQPREEPAEEPEEDIEWSESEPPSPKPAKTTIASATEQLEQSTPSNQSEQNKPARSPSVDFEDVDMTDIPRRSPVRSPIRSPVNDIDESIAFAADEAVLGENNEAAAAAEDYDFFSDPEEEELLNTLAQEAEEHARFASTLNHKTQAQNVADYENELKKLRNQQKKDRRDADEVTQVMVQECQQLLRLFGLPYITAPMEAEAQCAELVQLGLVDGIVTDDSDCFLFGGTRVYKNMFNSAKFVECYLTSDMEKEFSLTRGKLISIAQLLGSDYTEGLTGVGPVTALEIISEFDTLTDFKNWLEGVQLQRITKEQDKDNPFRKKFRKTATKLMLPTAFPDSRVEMAYLDPDVDKDPQAFQWGVPDLDALRSFLMATIGWSQERTDEVLVPVIKDMNQRQDEGTQANITRFFAGGVGVGAAGDAFAPRKRDQGSKRLGNALSKMASRAKSKRGGGDVQGSGEDSASQVETPGTESEASSAPAKKTKKKPAQRKTKSSSVRGRYGGKKKKKKGAQNAEEE